MDPFPLPHTLLFLLWEFFLKIGSLIEYSFIYCTVLGIVQAKQVLTTELCPQSSFYFWIFVLFCFV